MEVFSVNAKRSRIVKNIDFTRKISIFKEIKIDDKDIIHMPRQGINSMPLTLEIRALGRMNSNFYN